MKLIYFCLLIGLTVAPKKKQSTKSGAKGSCSEFLSEVLPVLGSAVTNFTTSAMRVTTASYSLRYTEKTDGVIGKVDERKPGQMKISSMRGKEIQSVPMDWAQFVLQASEGRLLPEERKKIEVADFRKQLKKKCPDSSISSFRDKMSEIERICVSWSNDALKKTSTKVEEVLETAFLINSEENHATLKNARISFESEIFKSLVLSKLLLKNVEDLNSGKPVKELNDDPPVSGDDDLKSEELRVLQSQIIESMVSANEAPADKHSFHKKGLQAAFRVSQILKICGFSHYDIVQFMDIVSLDSNMNVLLLVRALEAIDQWYYHEHEEAQQTETHQYPLLPHFDQHPFFKNAVKSVDLSYQLRKKEAAHGIIALSSERFMPALSGGEEVLEAFKQLETIIEQYRSDRQSFLGKAREILNDNPLWRNDSGRKPVDELGALIRSRFTVLLSSNDVIKKIEEINEELAKLSSSKQIDSLAHIHSLRVEFERLVIGDFFRPHFLSLRLKQYYYAYHDVQTAESNPQVDPVDVRSVRQYLRDAVRMIEALSLQRIDEAIKRKIYSVFQKAFSHIRHISNFYQIGDLNSQDFSMWIENYSKHARLFDPQDGSGVLRFDIRLIEMSIEALDDSVVHTDLHTVSTDDQGRDNVKAAWDHLSPVFIGNEIRHSLEQLKKTYDSLMSGPAELTEENADNHDMLGRRYRKRATRLGQLLRYVNRRFRFELDPLEEKDTGILQFPSLMVVAMGYLTLLDAVDVSAMAADADHSDNLD